MIAGYTWVHLFISDFVRSCSLLPMSCQISGTLWGSRHLHLRRSSSLSVTLLTCNPIEYPGTLGVPRPALAAHTSHRAALEHLRPASTVLPWPHYLLASASQLASSSSLTRMHNHLLDLHPSLTLVHQAATPHTNTLLSLPMPPPRPPPCQFLPRTHPQTRFPPTFHSKQSFPWL